LLSPGLPVPVIVYPKHFFFKVRLKYEELYYRYRQKVDLLTALKQQPGEELPDEADALSDFFAFLRAGGVGANKEDQVLIVANSLDMLAFLHQKALPRDLAMIAGGLRKIQTKQLGLVPTLRSLILTCFILGFFSSMASVGPLRRISSLC
jgi:hypothetical protein